MSDIEQLVYRKRLTDALVAVPDRVPIEKIAARIRHEANVRDLLGLGFSHLVMTFLMIIARGYRVSPSKDSATGGPVESAPSRNQ